MSEIDHELEKLKEEHIPELTEVMTRAFDHDSQIHLGEEKGGPEGYDDGSFLRRWGLHEDSDSYVVKIEEGKLIGSITVFASKEREGNNVLGNMFIDPEYQNQGVGYRVWKEVESMYPEARSWQLGTPSWAIRNHHFYEKCGFTKVDEEETDDHVGRSFIFKKVMDK